MNGKNFFFSKTTVSTLLLTSVFILGAVFGPFFMKPASVEAQVGSSGTCTTMIKNYVSWAQKSPNNMVDSHISSLEIKTRDPNARNNFGFGRWGYARLDAKGNSLSGSYQEFFSDRKNGRQPFSQKATDWTGVSISPSSGVTLKLDSWGGTKIKVQDMSCTTDGFIVGRLAGNWNNVVTISLVKTYR